MLAQTTAPILAYPPRIAFLLWSLEGGGAERVTATLANSLAEAGATVQVGTSNPDGPIRNVLADNVEIIKFPNRSPLRTFAALARYMRGFGPGVVFSAGRRMDFMALNARRFCRCDTRVVPVIHSTCSHSAAWLRLLRSPLLRYAYRRAYAGADRIVAVSQGAATAFAQHFRVPREQIQVMYNPAIPDDLFHRAAEPIQDPWIVKGKPPVLVAVGRLVEAKDFETLLRAVALTRKRTECRLIVLGEGRQRPALESLAKELGLSEAVKFPGFVANPYCYLSRARVFVLSSRWEGLPTVLIEALALGIPVVATDCPSGPREILEEGRWGRLVPVGDAMAMAQSIEATLSESPRQIPSQAVERFRAANVRDCYLRLTEDLVAR